MGEDDDDDVEEPIIAWCEGHGITASTRCPDGADWCIEDCGHVHTAGQRLAALAPELLAFVAGVASQRPDEDGPSAFALRRLSADARRLLDRVGPPQEEDV